MEFYYSAPETFIPIPFVKFAAPIKVVFDYELYADDSFEIRGKIFYKLEGQCSRCLQEASVEVEGELEAYFEDRKDYEDYRYENARVDITQAVEDALMASMPFSLSCGADCKEISYHE